MVVDDVGILVLAHQQMAVGHHRDIVAIIVKCGVSRFHEQVDHPGRIAFAGKALVYGRHIAEDLPEFACTATGTGKVKFAATSVLAPENAFAPCEQRSPFCRTLFAQVVPGAFGIAERDPADAVLLALADLHICPVTRVLDFGFDKRERLQPPAFGQHAFFIGYEPVQQPVLAVFGQIGDAGAWIDAGGFMIETAHGL